jgi:phosphatidylglycerophosphatase C
MPSKPPSPRRIAAPVAAFDFDGTLTYRDSFNAFLTFAAGPAKLGMTALARPGPFLNYLKTRDRGALKSRFLYNVVGSIGQAELEVLIRAFVAATGMSLFRPDALERWRSLDGMTRVIVTASPELLVAPFGAMIGADRVIGSRLKFSAEGRLLPELDGLNCRGEEKMRRLCAMFGEDMVLDQAFGDTAGDAAMIAAAREGHYRVFRLRPPKGFET